QIAVRGVDLQDLEAGGQRPPGGQPRSDRTTPLGLQEAAHVCECLRTLCRTGSVCRRQRGMVPQFIGVAVTA
ncbi:hypothetical protein ABZV80_42605, partial [Streptomyces sp. NPDC005132]|uniref:hypothetical protein n=1 Tax=Streptomyces sp. NPDC005132 TaxID=3154294 RepID=UPI0033B4DFB6